MRRTHGRYVLVRGVLVWGITSWIIYVILVAAFHGASPQPIAETLVDRLSALPIWLIVGLLFGEVMWQLDRKSDS